MKKIIISIALLLSTAAHAGEIPVAFDVSGVPSGKSSPADFPGSAEGDAAPAGSAAVAVDLRQILSNHAEIVATHMEHSPNNVFNETDNVFFGINGAGINVDTDGKVAAVNPAQWFVATELKGWFYRIITKEQFSPKGFSDKLKEDKYSHLSGFFRAKERTPSDLSDNKALINELVLKTNLIKTENKLTTTTKLLLAGLTVATLYTYFKKR